MATLADTGSTQVNENNPYNLALANVRNEPAIDPKASTPNTPAPNDKSAQLNMTGLVNAGNEAANSGTPSPDYGIAAQAKAFEGDYPTASQSVENTPEAATKQQSDNQENTQQEAAFSKTVNSKSKGAQPPTEQQNVNQALAPDQSQLDLLPAEYKSVIAQLQPYISSDTTGDSALNKANAKVASEVGLSDNKVMAALKGLGTANKEFAGAVPYEGIIQALLGFGKYEETYAGAQPQGQSSWTQSMDEIYKYLSGSNASSNGLPSPTTAASTAGTTPATASDAAGGGNA